MIHLKESILESNHGHFLKICNSDSDSNSTSHSIDSHLELILMEKSILSAELIPHLNRFNLKESILIELFLPIELILSH